jgi:hypothetical protein
VPEVASLWVGRTHPLIGIEVTLSTVRRPGSRTGYGHVPSTCTDSALTWSSLSRGGRCAGHPEAQLRHRARLPRVPRPSINNHVESRPDRATQQAVDHQDTAQSVPPPGVIPASAVS